MIITVIVEFELAPAPNADVFGLHNWAKSLLTDDRSIHAHQCQWKIFGKIGNVGSKIAAAIDRNDLRVVVGDAIRIFVLN